MLLDEEDCLSPQCMYPSQNKWRLKKKLILRLVETKQLFIDGYKMKAVFDVKDK